jgi:hypothetical protein
VRLITRHTQAATAAEQWWEIYCDKPDGYRLADGRNPRDVHAALVAMGVNPDPDAVDAAVGNRVWTECHCEECGKSVDMVVLLGDDSPDDDSSTVTVCGPCLFAALQLHEGDREV